MPDRTEELAIIVRVQDLGSRALRSVNRELGGLEKGAWGAGRATARGVGTAIGNIERLAVVAGGAALTAGGAAVKMAMDYESSAASVRKTVNGDVTGILADIRKMATTTPVDVNDLNEIAAAAGALGVARGDIVEFTRTVALLGVTTDLTTDGAATSLGHLRTTLKLTGDDFHELGDEIVYLGNNGASTESEILSMAENIAGAANAVGASKEQVLGWASAMASAGEEAEAGGSSIQRFWLQSFKTVQKGGAGLKLMAKISHETVADFRRDFEQDATGTLSRFIVSLGKLSKAEQLATLEKLGFTDIRVTRALLALLGNTDNLTSSLENAQHAAGAMGKEAEQRFKTTASQVQLFRNNLKDAAITIGAELLPQINELLGMGTTWLQTHPGEIKEFAHDLGTGFKDAVTWAKQLDWDSIASSLKDAAGFARGIVQAFMDAPPWLQTAVVTGWGLNKLTGGALVDIFGSLGKGLVGQLAGQFVGRGSSPANPLWVASAQGGIPGIGGPGGGGAGVPLLGRLLTGAAGVGLGLGGSAVLGAGVGMGGAAGAGLGALGGAGMIAGGALLGGPIGAIIGAGLAVGSAYGDISARNKELADGIATNVQAQIAGGAKLSDLQQSLAAVETGIAEIESNPLNVLIAGEALDQLKAQRAALEKQVAAGGGAGPAADAMRGSTLLDRGGREAGGTELAGKIADDVADLVQLQRSAAHIHNDEIRRITKALTESKSDDAIRAALKAAMTATFERGIGGSGGARNLATSLRAALAKTHDPELQRELRSAIAKVEKKIVGREHVERQIKKADEIARSTRPLPDKLRQLQAIETDLKNRGVPNAANRIRERINALKATTGTVKTAVDLAKAAVAALPPQIAAAINPILYIDERPGRTSGSGTTSGSRSSGGSSSGSGSSSSGGGGTGGGGLRQFAAGTDYVPRTGPATIHQGEAVLDPKRAAIYRAALARPSGLMSAAAARATIVQIHRIDVHVMPRVMFGLRELQERQSAQGRLGKVSASQGPA